MERRCCVRLWITETIPHASTADSPNTEGLFVRGDSTILTREGKYILDNPLEDSEHTKEEQRRRFIPNMGTHGQLLLKTTYFM